jgi:hypothetical protein
MQMAGRRRRKRRRTTATTMVTAARGTECMAAESGWGRLRPQTPSAAWGLSSSRRHAHRHHRAQAVHSFTCKWRRTTTL